MANNIPPVAGNGAHHNNDSAPTQDDYIQAVLREHQVLQVLIDTSDMRRQRQKKTFKKQDLVAEIDHLDAQIQQLDAQIQQLDARIHTWETSFRSTFPEFAHRLPGAEGGDGGGMHHQDEAGASDTGATVAAFATTNQQDSTPAELGHADRQSTEELTAEIEWREAEMKRKFPEPEFDLDHFEATMAARRKAGTAAWKAAKRMKGSEAAAGDEVASGGASKAKSG